VPKKNPDKMLFHPGSMYNFIPDSRGRIAYPTFHTYRFDAALFPERRLLPKMPLSGNKFVSCIWPQQKVQNTDSVRLEIRYIESNVLNGFL
jgi:hypothetical protein